MSQPVTFQLAKTDRQLLLQIARDAVAAYLDGRKPVLPEQPPIGLQETRGVFVSLHVRGELRGCVGNLHPASPLYRSVAECAIAAAVGDPRFMPLTPMELPRVAFEISVLSPLERVENIQNIEIGKHGLLVRSRGYQGLLLPQVASTYGWNRERFLQETCKKAGLDANGWQQGATLESFTALVFSERTHDSM